MIRLLVPSLAGLISLALWLYAIFDVIQTDESLTRNLPKTFWLVLVILFPPIGPIAWLVVGRPLYAGFAPGGTQYRPPQRFVAPEDRPDFGSKALPGPSAEQLQRWEDDLARREREIDRGDDGAGDTDPSAER
ncbi:MAG: PLD nuclease N-terminal domain-containing protein [Acidimicrobiales bacterium]